MARFIVLALAFALILPSRADSLSLNPGTLLGLTLENNATAEYAIRQYDGAGNLLDSLALTLPSTTAATGLTTIDGRVFLFQQGGEGVLEVDLATGSTSTAFHPAVGREDLGRIGSNLILSFSNQPGNVDPGVIEIYSTAGSFIQRIEVDTQASAGIDSDGSRIFLADQPNGLVRTFDLAGNQLGSFSIGGIPNGLAYDGATDSLWVADFESHVIRRYSTSGALLGDFVAGGARTDDLTVVPIPEPGTGILIGIGLASLSFSRRLARHFAPIDAWAHRAGFEGTSGPSRIWAMTDRRPRLQ